MAEVLDSFDHHNKTSAHVHDRAHVFHSWSAQALINPLPIAGAEGSWMWDYDDNRYLDFSSQLMNVNLGHQHPKLVAAIQEAAGRLCTIAPFHANADRSEAARLISEVAPDGMSKVFFTNGGAEATENAIRMARLHTGRHKILSAHRSYHGATHGSITMTGDPRRWPSEPSIAGVVRYFGPYPYRSSFHAETPEQECERALAHLDELIMFEGGQNIAAIILESIVGTNGILVPPAGYLAGVRELCDRHGIMMIADEVMAGFGRCGEWFAIQHWDVTPDLICFAKGVNSGYVPLGGVIISDAIAATFDERVYPGGLTYSGHPLACASIVASINIFREEGILEHADDARHRRDRAGTRCHGRTASVDRRGPRPRRLLGDRARTQSRDAGDAGAVQRIRRRCEADGRHRGVMPRAGGVGVHPLQPGARGAAVQHVARRRPSRPRRHRQGFGTGRRPRGVARIPNRSV